LVLWLRLCRSAGQPILAAAGFQPAPAGCERSLSARRSRLLDLGLAGESAGESACPTSLWRMFSESSRLRAGRSCRGYGRNR
jgi:hypothetical protein